MDKVGTKIASGRILIASLLALAVALSSSASHAADPPRGAISLAQRISARIQPQLPANLMVAEVTLPAAFVPFKDSELDVQWPHTMQPGVVNVMVNLRVGGDKAASGWVRVTIEPRGGSTRSVASKR